MEELDRGSVARVTGGAVLVYLATKTIKHFYRDRQASAKAEKNKKKLDKRKENLRKSLETSSGDLLTEGRKKIVALDVDELLGALRNDLLDPLAVLQAYQAKALEVDVKINAVCDFILEATEWAENLKTIPASQRGCLYGIPISVKECFYVKGYDATAGIVGKIGLQANDDCDFIKFIKDNHGIPFCITNVPQTMVSYSCSNPVYGNTGNPHDLTRTPGGSSGGEGALIGAGGSILGLGTDVGGSLRIPAHFSGVVGLKPTTGRIYEGGRIGGWGNGGNPMRPLLMSVAGYMSSSVAGIRVGMQALLQSSRKMSSDDWRVVPVQWQDDLYKPDRKLVIGWYDEDGFFPVTPGCKRAVREVVCALKEAGHTVIEWEKRDHTAIMQVFLDTMLSDMGHHALKSWKGEKLDKAIEVLVYNYKTPWFLRGILSAIFSLISPKMKMLWNSHPTLSRDLWKVAGQKDDVTDRFFKDWANKGFDVVICPGFAFPAVHPIYPPRILAATSYTAIYNTLECPVGMVPVTRENDGDQKLLENYPVKDDFQHRLAYDATKGATGCPIGVQVVGRKFQEELVIHAMEVIEDLVQYNRSTNL